ncbi:MAG TPA: sigma-70 family RNA polymerase sigma factor [Polyangiaceae bacterium]|jgi:RNA polymerase sigma-70 factor (ECF subfamily)
MTEPDLLARRFEESRPRLRAVAYRMLGSKAEAEDAVQEAWIHASRDGATEVANLGGWLTTVVARVCLDMLRSRKSRREATLDEDAHARTPTKIAPEDEALLADSVGVALLVVLETLAPAERVAFVLHDSFDVPFEEIATILGRSPDAVRQLASRARRRVHGAAADDPSLAEQRTIVSAFLAALRAGDVEALVRVLDPDLVVHGDGGGVQVRGARQWAKGAVAFSRAVGMGAVALVDGSVGLVLAPGGKLQRALRFTFAGGKIATAEVVAEPSRVAALDVRPLD